MLGAAKCPLAIRRIFDRMGTLVVFWTAGTDFYQIKLIPPAMQINISARHGNLSDATKEKITQKISKIQRFFERLTSIDVTVDLSKADEPDVEVIVHSINRNDFVASYRSGDMFGALDQVISKLEQQIKKHKEKLQDRGKNVPAEV